MDVALRHVVDAISGKKAPNPIDVMKTPGGAVGVTTFPLGVFDADGRTQYYLSALSESQFRLEFRVHADQRRGSVAA